MALSRVQGHNIYVGGVLALNNKFALREANITHIVSVLRMRPEETLTEPFQSLKIPVDDSEDEDLLQYFSSANAFIQSGLDAGGSVLIHCAMGKSRSVSVCIAYLLHREPQAWDPETLLTEIRKTRSIAEPNEDFMRQLWLYHEMGCPEDVTSHPMYMRWLSNRHIELSTACGRAPEMDIVRFEDELPSRESMAGERSIEIRCRKCRRILATTPFINPHDKQENNRVSYKSPQTSECAHIFLHPLTWMRPSLFPDSINNKTGTPTAIDDADAPLSGRLTCPNAKCEANVGKFAWQGFQCSCGKWVVPAIGVARARVDVTDQPAATATTAAAAAVKNVADASSNNNTNSRLGAMGIRLPPHMRAAHADPQRNNL